MELASILQVLWRRRLLTICGVVLAVAMGVASSYKVSLLPPSLQSHDVGTIAVARVLVDTPRSLLADPHPSGTETISTRAALLGELLASDEVAAQIATAAGVASSKLAVLGPDSSEPIAVTPLSQGAAQAALPREPYVITVEADPFVSTVSVVAEAPDPDSARRLAEAATSAMGSLARGADPEQTGGVSIQPLGEPAIEAAPAGQGLKRAALVALIVGVLWISALVARDGIVRRRLSRAPQPSASPSVSRPSPS